MFRIHNGKTQMVMEEVERCESIDELKEILQKNSIYHNQWKSYICYMMEKRNLSYLEVAALCACSKNTVKKWMTEGKIPQNREGFFKIILGFSMTVEEANEVLQRYGKYPALYPKSMEDAICIFALEHPQKEKAAYQYYLDLKEYCVQQFRKTASKQPVGMEERTEVFYEQLISWKTEEKLIDFIVENQFVFQKSYHRLIEYIDMFIYSRSSNVHEFLQDHGLGKTYNKILSNLRNKGVVPNRMKLIVLGLHFNMSLEQLNEMLRRAYMEPVCAKDSVECAVMYAVENAYLNNPCFAYENAVALQNTTNDWKVQNDCARIIKEYWESKTYSNSLQMDKRLETDINEYLKWVLGELEFKDSEIMELL